MFYFYNLNLRIFCLTSRGSLPDGVGAVLLLQLGPLAGQRAEWLC